MTATALSTRPCPSNPALNAWVDEIADLTEPEQVVWVTGSDAQRDRLTKMLVEHGTLIPLRGAFSGSYLARSDPRDVARVVKDTHICSPDDAGPLSNWWNPAQALPQLEDWLAGAMHGRTMYVVPFSMGPLGSALGRIAVQLTDSPYVVLNMLTMARCGQPVLDQLGAAGAFVRAVHSVGVPLEPGQADMAWPCNPDKRRICHFPQHQLIISFGSGYGGNALLGKKCLALRLATALAAADPNGAMAEHMMVIEISDDATGQKWYVSAAFPSACGKTNLAMLQATIPGYTVKTIGDDIAWIRLGDDGRLYAINPEAGFFGVAPGTGPASNPVAVEAIKRGSLLTNVAYNPDSGEPWWPELSPPPARLITWKGEQWLRESGVDAATTVHANSRFTTPYASCGTADVAIWNSPEGVPLDVILFGGRRPTTIPLVRVARGWEEGVLLGAMISSATTAAADGEVGKVAHDPFAMAPFFGLAVTDYIRNWLRIGARITAAHGAGRLPLIAAVNWFRQSEEDGHFLWPGFGDNARVIDVLIRYLKGEVELNQTPIGLIPAPQAFNLDGLDVTPPDMAALTTVEIGEWLAEVKEVEEYFRRTFGDTLPAELLDRLAQTRRELEALDRGQ
ncbi:MAG TPA: phosphoenolpyruvate carboxykinase (GTP) [Streptosporangiaceae bacterium]|nr:phosphoenolpyruvate carboxykinase (GTP) [Streptosporangiaceae bacterium]